MWIVFIVRKGGKTRWHDSLTREVLLSSDGSTRADEAAFATGFNSSGGLDPPRLLLPLTRVCVC